MAKIKTNVAGQPLTKKLAKGTLVIDMSTDNPNVPGNEALVAALAEAQAELTAAVAAAAEARLTSIQRTLEQSAAEKKWRARLNALASYTEAITGGAPNLIVGTGFDVRAEPTPTHVPGPVGAVTVETTATPEQSKLKWEPLPEADGYVAEGSADPKSESSWTHREITTKAGLLANGALAGRPYWYRVAAFNSAGQGPWSQLASRPVR
jgi:hypothetical protein